MPWFLSSGLVSIAGRSIAASLLAMTALGAQPASPPGEIRDIAAPVEMPEDPVWPYYAGAGVLGAAAAVFGLRTVRRRRAAREAEAAAARLLRPPHEVALEALEALATAPPAAVKAYYVRLIEILRGYIAGRFGVDEPDATSSELLALLCKTAEVAPEHQRLLRALFAESDLVKFAGARPAQDAPSRALQACRTFVRETAEVVRAL